MKHKECPQELKLIQSLRSGDLKQEIEKHIAECPSCRETTDVILWMKKYAGLTGEPGAKSFTPPHPDELWNKAHSPIYLDRDKVKKALRPLKYGRIFSFAVAAVGMILILVYGPLWLSKSEELNSAARLFTSLLQKIGSYLFPFIMFPLVITLMASLFFAVSEAIARRRRSLPAG